VLALPHALAFEGLPPAPAQTGPVAALVALALAGTVIPFWLFAYGQAHVPAGFAGAFLNLEPLVGVVVGWVGFNEVVAANQLLGGVAVLAGIALSTRNPSEERRRPRGGRPRPWQLRPLIRTASCAG
jgi:O-acetylserine/cysteine efflux transporter